MPLRAIVISLLVAATLQCADAADVPRALKDFDGLVSAGTARCRIRADVIGDQLQIHLYASDSSLPSDLRNNNVTPFNWKRVKVWVLTEDGKTAPPLPYSESPIGDGGGGSNPGPLVWTLNRRFEHAGQAAAVVLQIDSTFHVFLIPQPVK